MIETVVSTALSAALFVSATLPIMVFGRRARDRDRDADTNKSVDTSATTNIIENHSVNSMIRNGYAYSVDLGDSMVVVVVLNKEGVANSFATAKEEPIPVLGIDEVAQIPAEA